ncbi:MAG: molybdopterin-dependent oxidoreductase [Chloroflexi bacterium]|nr:molybdopterin-dependent oxidoreductase [Chloroflexota bacterium]
MRMIARRDFLRWVLGSGIGAFLTACGRRGLPAVAPSPSSTRLPANVTPGGAAGTSTGTPPLTQQAFGLGKISTTPNETFYVVDIGAGHPKIDLSNWRLELTGAIKTPRSLTMDDLQALPRVTEMRTLECISNPVGGKLIGNAIWEGVRMRDVLKLAGVTEGAVELMVRSADGFFSSIPLELARHEHALLVWAMNGVPLPRDHGFPLRCLWPGRYGMKQPRWVTKMELLTEPQRGYWELQGWSNEAKIKTNSQIREPMGGHQLLPLKPLSIRGTAFSGKDGIARAEVSTDNGQTWSAAKLVRGPAPVAPYVWTEWAYDWMPVAAGSYVIQVRATDNSGFTQKEVGRSILGGTYPDGTALIHAVTVNIREG